jgi:nickel transport protein
MRQGFPFGASAPNPNREARPPEPTRSLKIDRRSGGRSSRRVWVAAQILVVLTLSTPAQAHKLKVFATAEGAEIVGTAYFAGGGKAMGVEGRLLAADGTEEARFTTAADGSFRLGAPAGLDHTIVVDAGDGHVARTMLAALEPAEASGSGQPMDAVEAAVARQIRPLREQLDAYEERVRLHDLMGGIGTIFGLFGVFAWVRSRRGGSS